jgi:hypothetical protein
VVLTLCKLMTVGCSPSEMRSSRKPQRVNCQRSLVQAAGFLAHLENIDRLEYVNKRFALLASFEEMEAGEDSATAELSNTDLHLRCERKLF